ncbi:MAG TPA: hypothetical protein VIL72_02920, partial [Beijerinckiaceae bacterium]
AGHRVELFGLDAPALRREVGGLSRELEVIDLRDAVPSSPVLSLYLQKGHFSLFSDIVRLALLRGGRGVWADADCVFLRAVAPADGHVMGWVQVGRRVGNGVLLLPRGGAALEAYWRAVTEPPLRAPWATLHIRAKREIAILFGRAMPADPQKMSIGPRALTHFVKAHGLERFVSAPARFYPVDQGEAALLVDPDPRGAEAKIGPASDLVHAWRGNLAALGLLRDARPPAGSWLARRYDDLLG